MTRSPIPIRYIGTGSAQRQAIYRSTMMLFSFLERYSARLRIIERRWNRTQKALGRIEARQLSDLKPDQIMPDRVQSSFTLGEDGIVQHLLQIHPGRKSILSNLGCGIHRGEHPISTGRRTIGPALVAATWEHGTATSTIISRPTYPGDSSRRNNFLTTAAARNLDGLIRDQRIQISAGRIDIDGNIHARLLGMGGGPIDLVTPAI